MEKREKQTGFNWREHSHQVQTIAYFHGKFCVCIRVCDFQIIEWFSKPTGPGVTASQPEEGFHLCRMETEGNHLPNSPAGDDVCLYTDIHTLNIL